MARCADFDQKESVPDSIFPLNLGGSVRLSWCRRIGAERSPHAQASRPQLRNIRSYVISEPASLPNPIPYSGELRSV